MKTQSETNVLYSSVIGFLPLRLYVLINGTSDYMINNFECDGESLNIERYDEYNTGAGIYSERVYFKKTHQYGFILSIKDINNFSQEQIVHETNHLTKAIWKCLNEDEVGYEADAYLQQFLFHTIDKNLKDYRNKYSI